ncbi:hypothetical protein ACROYT_G003320 [Oculina patagonica]
MHVSSAISRCSVDVAFIMDSSECISQASFQKEKNFVKQAALKLGAAPGQSRAAIIQFSRSVSVQVTLGRYPSKQAFEGAVDRLQQEIPRTPSYEASTQIDEALKKAAQEVFSTSATSTRRIAILLTDGKQLIGNAEVSHVTTASVSLRKLGVRLIIVTMGTSSTALNTILKLVTERNEDVVMENQFSDLLSKLPRMIACGSCVCTSGDSYITIDNYQSKKKRAVDDIRFEFKSEMSGPGLIMTAKGSYVDHVSVGYKNKRLWYSINVGSGESKIQSIRPSLNKGWHKVHITRNEKSVEINIEDSEAQVKRKAVLPGNKNRLDIPSGKGYFLGAPTSKSMTPNFVGCIRYFTVDGYEPIVNAWARSQGSSIVKGSIRPCTASDEKLS